MTDDEKHIISHALGLYAKDKAWRHHFYAPPIANNNSICKKLAAEGLLRESKEVPGMFYVTEKAADSIGHLDDFMEFKIRTCSMENICSKN